MSTPFDFSRYFAAISHEQMQKFANKPGLWANIRAKRERGGKPAQPGDKDYPDSKSWKKVTNISAKKQASSPAWQRAEGKNEEGGLNAKGRASYNKATGGNLKAPVTEKNPKGKREKRQNSFCARMCGMKRVNTGAKTKSDPDSRINKSLRKWNCKCGSATECDDLEKQAFLPIGTTLGTIGGLITGRENQKMRAAGRGAIKGLGFDVGVSAGAPLGALLGLPMGPGGVLVGGVAGGLGGGVLGSTAAGGLLGPDETDEEKFERLLAARENAMAKYMKEEKSAFDFGRKLAAVTTCAAPEHNDQSGVDVNPVAAGTPEGKEKLTKKKLPPKAEDVIGKKAESHVNFVERKPKDQKVVRNGGNLNPVSAGEDHEEVEEDTDNDAYEFGKKMAQMSAEEHAKNLHLHQQDVDNWARPRPHRGLTSLGNAVVDSAGPAARVIGTGLGIPGANLAGLGLDAANVLTHGVGIADDMARTKRIRSYVEDYNRNNPTQPLTLPPSVKPRVRPPKPLKTPAPTPTPGTNNATPASSGSLMDYAPYAVGGLGAAGLAALVYSMMNERKKKKKDDDELEV